MFRYLFTAKKVEIQLITMLITRIDAPSSSNRLPSVKEMILSSSSAAK
jgi:hypothetical protein